MFRNLVTIGIIFLLGVAWLAWFMCVGWWSIWFVKPQSKIMPDR